MNFNSRLLACFSSVIQLTYIYNLRHPFCVTSLCMQGSVQCMLGLCWLYIRHPLSCGQDFCLLSSLCIPRIPNILYIFITVFKRNKQQLVITYYDQYNQKFRVITKFLSLNKKGMGLYLLCTPTCILLRKNKWIY